MAYAIRKELSVLRHSETKKGKLFVVNSASGSGNHNVTHFKDGKWWCDCMARRFNSTCKHIEVAKGNLSHASVRLQRPKAEEGKTKKVKTKYPVELLEQVSLNKGLALLSTGKYLLQEKLDGYRLQIRKDGGTLTGYNRKGQVKEIPDEVCAAFLRINASFMLDGELVEGEYHAFDLLEEQGVPRTDGYATRFRRLEHILGSLGDIHLAPTWEDNLEFHFLELQANRCEGAALKLKKAIYQSGRNGSHKKVKFWKTASVIVTEVRPGDKDSIRMGLYAGNPHSGTPLVNVGRVSAIGKVKAKVGDIVEIKYLYATKDQQFYQAELLQVRDDLKVADCTIKKQMVFKKGV